MSYTITFATDVAGNQEVSLNKSGNKFIVYLDGNEDGVWVSKQFDTIEQATAVYMKIVEAFATGCYSWKDRAAFLK